MSAATLVRPACARPSSAPPRHSRDGIVRTILDTPGTPAPEPRHRHDLQEKNFYREEVSHRIGSKVFEKK